MENLPCAKAVPVQLNLPPRSGAGPPQGMAYRGTATGLNGMVACAHPLAAQAGLRTLAAGGNAIDAAIAVQAFATRRELAFLGSDMQHPLLQLPAL